MATNLIQIKRSLTNANPVGLANGELAFTANGDVLFIGSPNGATIAIGGVRTPGVLTANQALVANTTSGIDRILVANLAPTQIWANGGFGSSGQVLSSNGTSLFWNTPTAGVAGSDTQIQFNDGGILAGDTGLTFNKTTDTITVGGGATINSTTFSGTANNATNLGGQAAAFYTNASNITTGTLATARLPATANISTAINVGANVNLTTTAINVGNTTVNTVVSAGAITINGVNVNTAITGNAATAYTNAVTFAANASNITTGTLSSDRLPAIANVVTAVNVGANVNLSTTALNIGNTTVNTNISAGTITINGVNVNTAITSNAATAYTNAVTYSSNASNLSTGTVPTARLGSGTANSTTFLSGDQSYKTAVTSVAGGSGLSGGTITTTGTIAVLANNGITANATGVYVTQGTGTVVNATGVHVNSSYIGTLTANNATNLNGQPASFYTNATNLATGTVPTARLGSGTADATTFLSGDQTYKTAVTSVATGSGLTGGAITTSGTVSILANNGIIANSTGTFVRAGTGVTVNSTGVHIGQAVGTTDNVTFANVVTTSLSVTGSVSSNLMPSANNTYHIGNTTIKWAQIHAANVHGVTGIFDGNVEVAGDLIVSGNVITTNVGSLIVGDAKILLAANNPGDLLDIGFSGTYTDGGATVRHAGLYRDASDNGVFKFFANTTQNLTGNNVIDTAAVGYTTAILDTYLRSGALTSNASAVVITANSTVNVAITANTLSLTTALPGTSGGTGLTTVTQNAILVGNATNGYNQLTLGTAGYVLQSNGSALVYDTLDGGTF